MNTDSLMCQNCGKLIDENDSSSHTQIYLSLEKGLVICIVCDECAENAIMEE